ncbi:MAG: hypothetical protein RDV00_07375 [Clostridia bacterium]|nr:hypothetical protein [Clostridia bacterium]MDQ7791920.1 hypothetical protein [Clostridia bacterium]
MMPNIGMPELILMMIVGPLFGLLPLILAGLVVYYLAKIYGELKEIKSILSKQRNGSPLDS